MNFEILLQMKKKIVTLIVKRKLENFFSNSLTATVLGYLI